MTPEGIFLRRRDFVSAAIVLGAGWGGALAMAAEPGDAGTGAARPAPRNDELSVDLPHTPEELASRYNNFYEFGTGKDVWRQAQRLVTDPWTLEIGGLVSKPVKIGIEDLVRRFDEEERVYRLRCVETWAMVVPWIGIPLAKLLAWVDPLPEARYLRFWSFQRPSQARGQLLGFWYPWPYTEGLTLAEARNDLALLATGVYGKALPKQHGAPVRLVVPWKYGFKSIKSVVRIELVAQQPATFWNSVTPEEYGFVANVNPEVPHPRWSQATEKLLGSEERQPTLLYNGYERWVAGLYGG